MVVPVCQTKGGPQTDKDSRAPNKEKAARWRVERQSVGTAPGADQSAPRIARSEEDVPAMFGGLVWPDPINAFATSRTKPNMNPPTTAPYITETDT